MNKKKLVDEIKEFHEIIEETNVSFRYEQECRKSMEKRVLELEHPVFFKLGDKVKTNGNSNGGIILGSWISGHPEGRMYEVLVLDRKFTYNKSGLTLEK